MAYLAVDKDGSECLFTHSPSRGERNRWWCGDIPKSDRNFLELDEGSIKKLIGRELTWKDEPVNI